MTDNQRLGLATWHLFAAERGDFFRVSQKTTWNGQNMLRVLDSRSRDDRFERMGVINDPDCAKNSTPDQFGFYLDNCPRDPYSSGIVGLRLRPNPDFDPAAWLALGNGDPQKAAEKWLHAPKDRFEWKSDEMAKTVAVEPPYEVAMTCTVCHASPNPLAPPANVNQATWKNIVFTTGNIFFREGKLFGDGIPDDDFLRQVLDSQHPGTSDTSRMATDHIHNPNTINAIFNLPYRPLHQERVKQNDGNGYPVYNDDIKQSTCDGDTCEVDTFRVLKDGADSSGVTGAALRVFINIGSCFSQFAAHMDPIWGKAYPESPISRRELTDKCGDYQHVRKNVFALVDYLKFVKPYHLKDAPGGAAIAKSWDDPQIQLGRQVFAEECATCHSSKQPEYPTGKPVRADATWEQETFATWTTDQQVAWLKDPTRVAWFKQQVEDPTFFAQNYLSDERRYPVSLIGTNAARALGTNAGPTGVWAEYASVDYQNLKPVDVPIYSFSWGSIQLTGTAKSKQGVGYYRTPSLWGVWATAPFLNNNSLGPAPGVSVTDKLTTFQASMEQLLGLAPRPTEITKTSRFSALTTIPIFFKLPFPIPGVDPNKLALGLPIPAGVPVAAIANLEVGIHDVGTFTLGDWLRLLVDPQFFMDKTKDFITVFDPIENKGHEFAYNRTEAEKRALIEFVKTL
jgi:cytochrome c5